MRNNKEVKIYMTTQIRKGVLTDFDLNKYLETDGKLLTSKGLAKMLIWLCSDWQTDLLSS